MNGSTSFPHIPSPGQEAARMAPRNPDLLSFVQRYQALKLQRDSSELLMQDLLIYLQNSPAQNTADLRAENQRLQNQLDDATRELDDSRSARLKLQARLQDAESRAEYYSQGAELFRKQNQHIAVLIDGNGSIFREEFIRLGTEGGKAAANLLKRSLLEQCGELADTMQVLVKVFANLSGVAKAMKRDGLIQAESDLRDFFIGFSQAHTHLDFVDVGGDRDRLDIKIKEAAVWHMGNINCRQVVLGVSHNAGFAPFIKELLIDDQTKGLVTILESCPLVPELAKVNVNAINFSTIFRSEALQVGTAPATAPSSIDATMGPPSYAGVTSAPPVSPPPKLNLPLAAKLVVANKQAKQQPPWNPGPRGLDSPLKVNQAVLDNIKKRTGSAKLCNNHYLRGPCVKKESCCFEHNYQPNAEEKVAISFLARLNPCTNGQDCEIDDCIYGHHCPSTINGQCQHPYCKFRPDEHPTGTKYKSTYRNGESYST